MNSSQQQHLLAISQALSYFDIFNFPLTKEEIIKYSPAFNTKEFEECLASMLDNELIFKLQNYYSLRNEPQLAHNRDENSNRASEYKFQAERKSSLISQFPFVKGVFISGSMSKGVMDKGGDIDFFIVTQPNRLWIARTLLILYKKIFLLNSRKYFCINYLVDENSLEISNKNRFTAVELLSLFPMVNENLHQKIIAENNWVLDFFSGQYQSNPNIKDLEPNRVKIVLEKILANKIGDLLDDFFMHLTLKRWKQKFGNMSDEDFNIALQTSKTVSKHHPSNFQKKVLTAFEERMHLISEKVKETESKLTSAR
ncbi:MAG: nucleotidyltransferase domain-containing protein [Salibacteraceae bacterium]